MKRLVILGNHLFSANQVDLHVRLHAGPSCDQSLVNEAFQVTKTVKYVLFHDWDRIVCIVGRGGDGDRAQRERMCRPNLGQVCVEEVITPTQCREVCAVIMANWFPGHMGRGWGEKSP